MRLRDYQEAAATGVFIAWNECTSALAVLPRNCDVGTPEEQVNRFKKYCKNKNFAFSCSGCPLNENNEDPSCFTLWLQLPYEEGRT